MGGKVSNTLRKQKSTFMSAGEAKYAEQVEHIYNTGGFGDTPQERYDAIDEAITDDDALVEVLKQHGVQWPSSVEDMNAGAGFFKSLSEDQAKALLDFVFQAPSQ